MSLFGSLYSHYNMFQNVLGLGSFLAMGNESSCLNCSLVNQDCGSSFVNGSCHCHCSDNSNVSYGAAFASFSYLLLLVSSIQLVLVIVYDAVQGSEKSRQSQWWAKAFSVTVQKCLLGAVVMAAGTRAIYYTVIPYIPTKWGDILLNLYYPALLSAFSLLICFWAEFFYHSSPVDGSRFLRKYKYSVPFLIFSAAVYLLLIAGIVATPLISDQEQLKMTGIISTIFAFLLLLTLAGFLHFAIRLFFRPDWQPLSIQLAVLKVNLRQQAASICGIVTNAFMQALIIALLLLNMVGRFKHIDSDSLYVCAIIIRVTELILPVWFCCSLWNYKKPKTLWILNPRLILKQDAHADDAESSPILTNDPKNRDYGTIQGSGKTEEDGCCWVCQGVIENNEDLFYPCRCKLHRNCIRQWVAKRASNSDISEKEYLRCQVCRQKYHVKRFAFLCIPRGLQKKHWVQLFVVLFILGASVVGCVYAGKVSTLNDTAKIVTISCVVVFNAVLLKLLGCCMVIAWRKSKYSSIYIKGISVSKWQRENKHIAEVSDDRTSLSNSVRYDPPGTVTIESI